MDETFSDIADKSKLPERHDSDLYITERTLIRAALAPLRSWTTNSRPFSVLDIGAGDGRWGQIARALIGDYETYLTGVDIRLLPEQPVGYDEWHHGWDFLKWQPAQPADSFDLIVSNPPYYCAEDIIRGAWKLLKPCGRMVMLLRSDFMNGVGRYQGLWNEIYPYAVGTVSRRPSFYGGGKTNRTPYCVFYWKKAENGRPSGFPQTWSTFLLLHERESKEERVK